MAMTLRADKGAILSWNEMDANFKACLGIHNLLHVQDQKSTGTYGGTITSGAWRTRDLNTVLVNNISGASLATNQITLPAGEYFIDGYATAYYVSNHKARIVNISDSSTLIIGSSEYTYGGAATYANTKSIVCGIITIPTITTIQLQHICSSTRPIEGFGMTESVQSGVELYSDLKIWKIGA